MHYTDNLLGPSPYLALKFMFTFIASNVTGEQKNLFFTEYGNYLYSL